MRPSESSLATPRPLVALAVLAAVAAIVVAGLPRTVVLYRYPTFLGRMMSMGRSQTPELDADEAVQWSPESVLGMPGRARPGFVAFLDDGSPESERLSHDVFGDMWCAMRLNAAFACVREPSIGDASDAASVRAMRERFGVRRLPTVIFFDPDGHEVQRFEGDPGRSRLMRAATHWQEQYAPANQHD